MKGFQRLVPVLFTGLFLARALSPALATAGAVYGTLKLPDARSRVRVASSGQPQALGAADLPGDAIVSIERIPDKLENKLAKKAGVPLMAQCYGAFIPRVVAVRAGTAVLFENQDRVYHNVFSVSPARKFDVGKYGPRESRQVVFDKPGIVQVFCELDPDEMGYVCVMPNDAFVRPDANGAFKLPKLPPGQYTVKAWHPRFGMTRREFVMTKRGDVSIALALPASRSGKAR